MIVLILWLSLCLVQVRSDSCGQFATCKQCVRSSSCQWCSDENYAASERCMSSDKITASKCNMTQIQNPKGLINVYIDNDFSSATQLRPQHYKIKLRPSESQSFNLQFKAAKDYPADLYFLFDSSNTMNSVINTAAQATSKIYEEMTKKTANVFLGMGTFNDKNIAPFVRKKTTKISSFSHKLNMTNDYTLLSDAIKEVASTLMANVDEPEGGFDALAQVITCREEIGWRNESRKFIFLFTDATSHIAGDAKPAGIAYPYDGECHTKNGIYTKEKELDYPSPSIISELAVKEGVSIVFIIFKSDAMNFYKQLENIIQGSIADKLSKDDNDMTLVNVISKAYRSKTDTIKLDVLMAPEDHENIKIELECKDTSCKIPVNSTEPYIMQGKITLLDYYGKDHIHVNVTIENLKERLILDIDLVDCDCKTEINSTYCSHHGTKICGKCMCDAGRSGTNCDCPITDTSCKQPGVEHALNCNGRGDCECGRCVSCTKGFSGQYCECENHRCLKNCNDHGTCNCGKCNCRNGWTGEHCDCSQTPCKIINGGVCNRRGHCECGKCKCDDLASWDARDLQNHETCEVKCEDCHDSQCSKLKECAVCRQSYDENSCASSCGDIRVTVVDKLANINESTSICKNIPAGAGCYTRFHYQYDDMNYLIRLYIQTEMNCLPSYYMWGGGILVALLVIGILTLVGWKLLTDYRDRREYQRFLKMYGDPQGGCQNPIYENPTTTIRNPAFRKPSLGSLR